MNAQCAGDDHNFSVCDIANISSQSIDLNTYLDPMHTIGGTWSDDDNSGGFNIATGILNAQKIYVAGIYHYTYTVNGNAACIDNTATIEVTIGGYAGIPGPNNSICSSDHSYSLFQVFKGTPILAPQSGGTWEGLDYTGGLNTITGDLNASIPPPYNTYSYKYTIQAFGVCPETSSQISVSIYRSPEPGTPNYLSLCSNQLSAYTNVDLYNQLDGEDIGGVWSESGTSELSSGTDSTIDIQNIYNTKGPGYYRFTYTVKPPKDDRVCTEQSATVIISLGEQLDFTNATLKINPNPVCENEMETTIYSATLKEGLKPIANGSYRVSYTISGMGSFITTAFFSGGKLNFFLPTFSQVKDYTISIVDVTLISSPVLCSSIIGTIQDVLSIKPSPKIDAATLTIDPVCLGADAIVQFSGTSNLTDGNYDIVYNLSDKNTLNGIPATMNIIGGKATFLIPALYIPRTGNTKITIVKITNRNTGCFNSSTLGQDFTVNPSLDMSNLGVTVKDACINQDTEVKLTGLGTLTKIEVTYNLSVSNITTSRVISLIAGSGEVKFSIQGIDIPNSGPTTITINSITNILTGCFIDHINKGANFKVNPLPNKPLLGPQSFCTADNATVANLPLQGNQYQWFDSVTSTIPLTSTTSLQTKDYFVKETNLITGCSSDLQTVPVVINVTPQINSAILSIATVCQFSDVKVDLRNTSLPDGDYTIVYNLTGKNTATAITAVLTISGGTGRGPFTILSNLVPNAGQSIVTITNITNPSNCSNTVSNTISKSFTIEASPDITNLNITIKDICKGEPAKIELSGLGALTDININYSLEGANTVIPRTISLNVVDGNVNFEILATDVPNSGPTLFTMSSITNRSNGCALNMEKKVNFTVNPLPDVSNIAITVNNGCPNLPLNVNVTGLGILTKVTFNYTVLSGTNIINLQTDPLDVTEGTTDFTIPGSALSVSGTNSLVINDITNLVTNCSSEINSISQNFNILPIPSNPTADNQEFCEKNLATVTNLIPNETQYKWYDSAISTTPLQPNTPLIEGNYYLKEVSPAGCESNATTISVVLNSVATPTLNSNGQNYCGADKPTIQNLSNNTTYTGDLTWYNTPTSGIALANTDLLTEGTTYYGIDYNPNTKCISNPLEAIVTLTSCNVTPDGLTIPDGFSPNGDGVNDTFKILDIEYLFPNFTLEIFNRYGNILFKGNINKPDWDGKNSNSSFIDGDTATGVYFYIINYNKDNFSPRQGQLYLNR